MIDTMLKQAVNVCVTQIERIIQKGEPYITAEKESVFFHKKLNKEYKKFELKPEKKDIGLMFIDENIEFGKVARIIELGKTKDLVISYNINNETWNYNLI